MPITRQDVVQGFLNGFDYPKYLGLGISTGDTFHALRASRKVAVDPAFRFDVAAAQSANPEAIYHAVESDAYFAEIAGDARFDVIYIDVRHVFENALRDMLNAIEHLAPSGVIVIDNIYPVSAAAALTDPSEFRRMREYLRIPSGARMGDVYKLAMFIDSFMPAWSFRCVADNHGQLILWRRKRPCGSIRTMSAIVSAGYDRAVLERETFCFKPYHEILIEVQQALA